MSEAGEDCLARLAANDEQGRGDTAHRYTETERFTFGLGTKTFFRFKVEEMVRKARLTQMMLYVLCWMTALIPRIVKLVNK